jgi:quinol-cytochrome oxidoreductase complex cytochrome b subunit
MAIKVKTPYVSNFLIPHSCVVCSDTPGLEMKWKIQGAKSNWSGKQTTTLSLEFPICKECYTVSRNNGLAKFVTVMGVLIPIIICLLIPWLFPHENQDLGAIIGVSAMIAVVVLAIWLTNWINKKGFTPEQRERRKRVNRCAKISSFTAPNRFNKMGSILFEFENPTYAQAFATMNFSELL